MPRPYFALLSLIVALAPSAARAAGSGTCPDGWFCDPGAAPPASQSRPSPREPGRGGPPTVNPGPPPSASPTDEEPSYPPPSYPPPGGVEPGEPFEPDRRILLDAPPPPPVRVRRYRRDHHEWGFNLHLEDVLIGRRHERDPDAGMAGLGFAFRYRPLPPLAFEAGFDFLTGTDYQGYSRDEVGFLVNALVFLNPRDVVQIYLLGGVGISGANVTIAPRSGEADFQHHDEHYYYAGGQVGFGVELRASRHIAIHADLLGFIRGRTDDLSDNTPEFVDPETHRATNTSGGGLLRLGATLYW